MTAPVQASYLTEKNFFNVTFPSKFDEKSKFQDNKLNQLNLSGVKRTTLQAQCARYLGAGRV